LIAQDRAAFIAQYLSAAPCPSTSESVADHASLHAASLYANASLFGMVILGGIREAVPRPRELHHPASTSQVVEHPRRGVEVLRRNIRIVPAVVVRRRRRRRRRSLQFSQSLIDLRAVMSLALPAHRCYQSSGGIDVIRHYLRRD